MIDSKQQIEILKGAIKQLENKHCVGLCYAIKHGLGDNNVLTDILNFNQDYILKLCNKYDINPKPIYDNTSFWWGEPPFQDIQIKENTQARIAVLNKLIEELSLNK